MTVWSGVALNGEASSFVNGVSKLSRLPWWHYALRDSYECVNVWSHAIPGALFLSMGCLILTARLEGHPALAFFCLCAATTHLMSAVTHTFPRNPYIRKADHVGILALLAGTPLSALWVVAPEASLGPVWGVAVMGLISAFLPRVTRTCCFGICGGVMLCFYGAILLDFNLALQSTMYFAGGACYVRNGGHARPRGLTDHHLLHYLVTASCLLHCLFLTSSHS